MKIINLEMCGIGPYKEKINIDFSRFGDSGIFLITGPTGSGKTTIFDGITFALFGETSGSVREKTTLRSDFAGDDTEIYVRLQFKYKEKFYTVMRNPKYIRARKRGGGYMEERENAFIECDDKILASGVRETTEKVTDILRVDFYQFKQIAMIAQGEFMNLLVAKSDERTKIFRDIFNTKIYDTITFILKNRAKDTGAKLRQLNGRIEENIKMSKAPEEIKGSCSSGDYEEYLEKSVKEDEKNLRAAEKESEKIKNEIYMLAALMEKTQHDNSGIEQLRRYKADYERLIADESGIEEKQKRIDKGEKYLKVSVTERAFQSEQQHLDEFNKQLSGLEENIRDLKLIKEKLINKKNQMEEDREELGGLTVRVSELAAEIREVDELKKIIQDYRKKQKKYIMDQEKKVSLRHIYEEYEGAYRASAAGILALTLKERMPCPVCGSVSHPRPAFAEVRKVDITVVEKYRSDYEAAKGVEEKSFSSVTGARSIMDRILLKYGYDSENNVITDNEADRLYEKKVKDREECEKRIKGLSKIIEETEKLLNDNTMAIASKEALYENTKKSIERSQKQMVFCETQFAEAIEQQGFLDYAHYALSRISEEDEQQLKKEVNNYYAAKKSLEDTIVHLEKEYGERKIEPVEPIALKMEEYKGREKELLSGRDEINSRLSVNKQACQALTRHFQDKDKLDEYYGIIHDLERTAKGENPRKLVLEQYVLSSYFDGILNAANLRFEKMTNGRYRLYRVEEVESVKTKDSLEIEVLDNYTGKKRSVKTLSGGESFKAALSLALGMSDIIERSAGGIEIGTLFIDEGFGALDDESLNQAIEALTMLTKNHRLIGIISHVSELKERIGSRITVEKTATGSRITEES